MATRKASSSSKTIQETEISRAHKPQIKFKKAVQQPNTVASPKKLPPSVASPSEVVSPLKVKKENESDEENTIKATPKSDLNL